MSKFYRPEIDGLRGVAVLGVLFYHSEIIFQNLRIFPGGFLGVDLFFVISGYLITSLIIKEHQLKNFFSFKSFYKRRAKRLLPALLIVIIFSSLFSYFLLLPVHFEEFIKSVVSSIYFFSNIFFHLSGQAYGAQTLSKIPLLHTWSLSVEEQFYLLYPIFLVSILLFMKKQISIIFISVILLSLLFATTININHQSFNFYMLPSRSWELLIGALLGININQYSISRNKDIKEVLGIIGFFMIFFSFCFFKNTGDHPTYRTLVPVIGAYLIIQDNNKQNFINKLLSLKTIVFLGLISYSLYLWHHPIFSFFKVIAIKENNLSIKICLITLSVFLAFLTYLFVEKPFRENNIKIFKINKLYLLGILSTFIIIILFLNVPNQKKQYLSIAKDLYKKTWFITDIYFKPCFQRKTFFCSFNENKKNPTIFLVGDSIMASLQEELKDQLIKKNINFVPMTNAGCDFLKITNNKNVNCNKKIHENRIKKINSIKKSTIILHINYDQDIEEGILRDFLTRINNYLDDDYRVILIYPIPQMKDHVSAQIEKDIRNNKDKVKISNINFFEYLEKSKKIYSLFDGINHKNLDKIYPYKRFCNTSLKNKCVGNSNNNIYFIDRSHLSKKGSELINLDLSKIIDNIY